MADVSLSDLGSSSSPLAGLEASDYAGYGSGGNASSPLDLLSGSGGGYGSAAALGIGALGFGAILGQGESPLPQQFGQLTGNVPYLQNTGAGLAQEGHGLIEQGQSALAMGQAGQLTAPQQAQLQQYQSGLTNQSRQQWAAMGRNPDQDSAFIGQTADIDAKVNAMAQQEIQTTIQLGLGEISGGNALAGQGLGYESAANQALIAAGQAQLAQDKAYSDSLTGAFSAIGKLFGAAIL
jgi:hypothetical protein